MLEGHAIWEGYHDNDRIYDAYNTLLCPNQSVDLYALHFLLTMFVNKLHWMTIETGLKIWKLATLLPKVNGFLQDIVSEWRPLFSVKLHLDVLQKSILSQGVFLDNDNSQQILLNFR